MVYVTADQVRAIVDTDITNAEITELIEETDAFMDLELDTASLDAIVLRRISRIGTALICMLKDPNAQSLGEYSEDRAVALQMMKDTLEGYMKTAGGGIFFKYGYADLRWPVV